jgi:ABC-type protease/lipase transport system fused ATPase/permease subunit
VEVGRQPAELSKEQREQLHRAHQHLRNTSHALEALTVVEPVRGRWVAAPAPAEALEAAQNDLHNACREFWRVHRELLRCDIPVGALNE